MFQRQHIKCFCKCFCEVFIILKINSETEYEPIVIWFFFLSGPIEAKSTKHWEKEKGIFLRLHKNGQNSVVLETTAEAYWPSTFLNDFCNSQITLVKASYFAFYTHLWKYGLHWVPLYDIHIRIHTKHRSTF